MVFVIHQDSNQLSLDEPWLLLPNPWYKGDNLNEPSQNKNMKFLKNMLQKMNLGQKSDEWNKEQKRSSYPIRDCKTENEQINPNYLLH